MLLIAVKNKRLRTRRLAGTSPDGHKLTIETVRDEINKTLNALKPQAFCSSKEQICVQGPPGMPGPKGSRGKRGPRGSMGRKGSRGLTGEPGPHGKQGIVGPPGQQGGKGIKGEPGPRGDNGIIGPPGQKGEQGVTGQKGEQGIKGKLGPRGNQGINGPPGQKGNKGVKGELGRRGITGAKGEPGESISTPTVVISPIKQTVRENQNVVFQCSATGNPTPTVKWFRSDGRWTHRFRYERDGRLEGRRVTLVDTGKYICAAENLLGSANKSAMLTVEGKLYL